MQFGSLARGRQAPAGFIDDHPAARQVVRWAYGQAEAASAQLWVGLKYEVDADRRCLEMLGG